MNGITTYISNIFWGQNRSFIYIWLSKSEKFIYVGQTNDNCGTLGRSYSHIQKSGTLRERSDARLGLNIDYINDLYLFSYPLPQTYEFTGIETSYRLAVEFLVQFRLSEERKNLIPSFQIISRITSTDRTSSKTVKDLAESIVEHFVNTYNSI